MGNPRKRIEAIAELYKSESNYLKDLELWYINLRNDILNITTLPMKVKYDICKHIFKYVNGIYKLHKKIFEQMEMKNTATMSGHISEKEFEKNIKTTNINQDDKKKVNYKKFSIPKNGSVDTSELEYASIFINLFNHFNYYTKFVSSLPLIEHKFSKLMLINIDFKNCVNNWLKINDLENLGVNHFFYRPSSKIARYPLLLKAISKNTDSQDEAEIYTRLIGMFEAFNLKIDRIFQLKLELFNIARIHDLLSFDSFTGSGSALGLIFSEKKLYKSGKFIVKLDKNEPATYFHIYLFNREILITKESTDNFSQIGVVAPAISLLNSIIVRKPLKDYNKDRALDTLYSIYICQPIERVIRSIFFENQDLRDIYYRKIKMIQKHLHRNINESFRLEEMFSVDNGNIKSISDCRANYARGNRNEHEENPGIFSFVEGNGNISENESNSSEQEDSLQKDVLDISRIDEEFFSQNEDLSFYNSSSEFSSIINKPFVDKNDENLTKDGVLTSNDKSSNIKGSFRSENYDSDGDDLVSDDKNYSSYDWDDIAEMKLSTDFIEKYLKGSDGEKIETRRIIDDSEDGDENGGICHNILFSTNSFNFIETKFDPIQVDDNDIYNDDMNMVVFSTSEGIFKRIGDRVIKISSDTSKKMIYDNIRFLLIYISRKNICISRFHPVQENLTPYRIDYTIDNFYYGCINDQIILAIVSKSKYNSSKIYLIEVGFDQNSAAGKLKIKLIRKLYIGYKVVNINFVNNTMVISSKNHDIVNIETLNTKNILEFQDFTTGLIESSLEYQNARSIYKINNNKYLLCFDSIGFYINMNGVFIDHDVIFYWGMIALDFMMHKKTIICRNEKMISIFSLETGEMVFKTNKNNYKFVTNSNEPLIFSENKVYVIRSDIYDNEKSIEEPKDEISIKITDESEDVVRIQNSSVIGELESVMFKSRKESFIGIEEYAVSEEYDLLKTKKKAIEKYKKKIIKKSKIKEEISEEKECFIGGKKLNGKDYIYRFDKMSNIPTNINVLSESVDNLPVKKEVKKVNEEFSIKNVTLTDKYNVNIRDEKNKIEKDGIKSNTNKDSIKSNTDKNDIETDMTSDDDRNNNSKIFERIINNLEPSNSISEASISNILNSLLGDETEKKLVLKENEESSSK